MNVAKFVVLGALESIEQGSGYDIVRELDVKKISNWTEVKKGSIYHALKKLNTENAVEEVTRIKQGLYPSKTIFKATDYGREIFDRLQEEAFLGLYPKFYGFKLALKFNKRRSPEEIGKYGERAIAVINQKIDLMDQYLESPTIPESLKTKDQFFIEHERMLFIAERDWIKQAIDRFGK